jgi:hypothetical protein
MVVLRVGIENDIDAAQIMRRQNNDSIGLVKACRQEDTFSFSSSVAMSPETG